jgi:DNA-binding NarL/FixJ family response regulator
MMLLERERELALLKERLDRARAGHGSMLLISGEAGIGKSALARSIDGMLGDGQHLLIGSCDPLTTPAGLTTRELDVLDRLRGGETNAKIAATLYISPRTVENHVASIFAKLKVTSRRDAVRIAATLLDQRPIEEI